jgi:hypothetical protein
VRKKDNDLKCALIEYVNNAMWKTYYKKMVNNSNIGEDIIVYSNKLVQLLRILAL